MIAIDLIPAAALLVSPVSPAAFEAPQNPRTSSAIVAEFDVGRQKRTITRDDVALYLAKRHRNSDTGRSTIDHLIEVLLVKAAAKKAGAMPADAEVRRKVRVIETELLRRKGQPSLDQVLKQQRISREEFEEKTALGMAQQKLAAAVLRVDPEKVTLQQIAMWTKEERNKATIVIDQSKLPPGILARVNRDGEVTSLDVGRVLFTKITKDQLAEAVNRIAFEKIIAFEANRLSITLDEVEKEKDYAKRKRAFEANPANKDVDYEQWLEAFGSSKKKELESKTMETRMLHGKLVRRRYPDAVLDKRIAENRQSLMKRHGARRSMSIIFIRATDKPNKILRRDFPAALEHIQEIRKTILDKTKKRTFSLMAKIASDDPRSKNQGGRIGWQHADYLKGSRARSLPQEVLDAAFAIDIGKISDPIRTETGYFLVWVSGLEQDPDAKTLRERLLGEMAERYNRELFDAAKIKIKSP